MSPSTAAYFNDLARDAKLDPNVLVRRFEEDMQRMFVGPPPMPKAPEPMDDEA